jgi:hypothetical protein
VIRIVDDIRSSPKERALTESQGSAMDIMEHARSEEKPVEIVQARKRKRR